MYRPRGIKIGDRTIVTTKAIKLYITITHSYYQCRLFWLPSVIRGFINVPVNLGREVLLECLEGGLIHRFIRGLLVRVV